MPITLFVQTEICAECGVKRPTKSCPICQGVICSDCMYGHRWNHAFYDEDDEVCEEINRIICGEPV